MPSRDISLAPCQKHQCTFTFTGCCALNFETSTFAMKSQVNDSADDARIPPPYDPESAFSTKQSPIKPPTPLTPELDPPGADLLGLTAEEM